MFGANYVRLVGAIFEGECLCKSCLEETILENDEQAVIDNGNDMNAWLLQWQARGYDCAPLLAFQEEEFTEGLWCYQCSAAIFEPEEVEE